MYNRDLSLSLSCGGIVSSKEQDGKAGWRKCNCGGEWWTGELATLTWYTMLKWKNYGEVGRNVAAAYHRQYHVAWKIRNSHRTHKLLCSIFCWCYIVSPIPQTPFSTKANLRYFIFWEGFYGNLNLCLPRFICWQQSGLLHLPKKKIMTCHQQGASGEYLVLQSI